MTSLGQKLTAHQDIKKIIQDLTHDNISDATANQLNELFCVFNSSYFLTKTDGKYSIKNINEIYEKCFAIVKKEYSSKFMSSMATTMMLQDDEGQK